MGRLSRRLPFLLLPEHPWPRRRRAASGAARDSPARDWGRNQMYLMAGRHATYSSLRYSLGRRGTGVQCCADTALVGALRGGGPPGRLSPTKRRETMPQQPDPTERRFLSWSLPSLRRRGRFPCFLVFALCSSRFLGGWV